jgi:Flp pilus assembly protein TadG
LIGYRMVKRKSMRAMLKDWRKDCRGVAGVEFALVGGFLCLAVVNVADIGIYLYKRMNVENAALVGAMSALKACDATVLPATVKCPGLNAAVTAAIQSTSLGTAVTLSGSVSEGYYCVNSSNALQYVSSVASKPADCTAAGMPALQPADYVQVAVTFSYTPIFSGISVASLFPTPITKTAMVRML